MHPVLIAADIVGSLIFVMMIVTVFYLGSRTTLIKDSTCVIPNPVDKPFSFARSQIAWWTIIIVGAFIYIFLRTHFNIDPKGDLHVLPPDNILNSTAIILLGISAGTMGVGRIIDITQEDASTGRSQDQKKEGFFRDILSDASGISIHRYQFFLFNLVYGLYFILYVLYERKMPDFGPIELALMGISATTYVGLKASENNPQTAKVTEG